MVMKGLTRKRISSVISEYIVRTLLPSIMAILSQSALTPTQTIFLSDFTNGVGNKLF